MEFGEPGVIWSKVVEVLIFFLSKYESEQLFSRDSGTVIAASEKRLGQ